MSSRRRQRHAATHTDRPAVWVWAPIVATIFIGITVAAIVEVALQHTNVAFAYPEQVAPEGWVVGGDGTIGVAATAAGDVNTITYGTASGTERTYIGGSFTYVGEYTGSSVVVDGTTGALDSATHPRLNALATPGANDVVADGSGGWYAGGNFTNVNGTTVSNIVHFNADGTVDANFVPPSIGTTIIDLMLVGNTLYVGGTFSTPRSRALALDVTPGPTTGALLAWNPNPTNGGVNDFAYNASASMVYLAGSFTTLDPPNAGSTIRQGLAAVDPVSGDLDLAWSPIVCSGSAESVAVKADNSAVFVGGSFTVAASSGGACGSPNFKNRLAAFDGANGVNVGTVNLWNPNANTGSVTSVLLSADESTVYVGGSFTTLSATSHVRLGALSSDPTNATPVIAAWVGRAEGTVNDLALKGTEIVAVGAFTNVMTSTRRYRVAAFDGGGTGAVSSWDPKTNSDVNGVDVSGTKVFLAGFFSSAGGHYRNRVAAFTTSTGELDTGFDPGTTFTSTAAREVNRIVFNGSDLYVGGSFNTVDGAARNRLAKLNAVTGALDAWNPNITDTTTSQVEDLQIDAANSFLYVAGAWDSGTIGGAAAFRLARVNTTTAVGDATWVPTPNGTVHVIRQDASNIYAGGEFTKLGIDAIGTTEDDEDVGKVTKTAGAAADATFLSPFASSVSPQVHMQISGDGSQLYVYRGADSATAPGRDLARISTSTGAVDTSWFDGTRNTSGTRGAVFALELDEAAGKVYVGGNFTQIGGINNVGNVARQLAAELGTDGTVSSWNPGFNEGITAANGVRDMLRQGANLYAGGTFTVTGRSPALRELRRGFTSFSNNNTIQFTLTSSSGSEATTPANLQVTLAVTDGSTSTVDYAVTGGTALGSGVDYTLANGQATIPGGSLTTNIPVTIVNDAIDEDGETIEVTLSNPSANVTLGANTVHTFTIVDNDTAGVTIVQSGGSTDVTEGGATDTYTVVLTSQPTAQVDVALSFGADVTATPSPLQFDNTTWSTPQTVTVTAVDDLINEGNHSDSITHTVTSVDAKYNGLSVANVTVNITDDDFPSVQIVESGGSTSVTEGGAGDSYTLVLGAPPTDDVVVTLSFGGQITATPTPLTFTTGDWDTPKTVTVGAVDDDVDEPLAVATITHSVASSDLNYNGLAVDDVDVNVTDNDAAGVIITESSSSTDVTEGGATDSYTAVLTSEPASSVSITVSPSTQVTATPTPLTFTSGDWDTPKTVTVGAVDDQSAEGTHGGLIAHSASSSDGNYNGVAIVNVTVVITDNDTAGTLISQTDGSTTVTEGGASDTYSIVLQTKPVTNVSIAMTAGGQVSASPTPLTFTSINWNVPQVVTVAAINDLVVEGTHGDLITHSVSSADPFYDGISMDSVTVTVLDNDSASTPSPTPAPAPTPTPTPTPAPSAPASGLVLIDGQTAAAQSVAVSLARFPADGSASGLVIATDQNAVDAFTVGPFASQNSYTLLLSGRDEVTADVVVEARRALGDLNEPVFLIGGVQALSATVEEELSIAGMRNQSRLAGDNRRTTAKAVADAIAARNPDGATERIFVAEDTELVDGVSAGAAGGDMTDGAATPILISRRGEPVLDPSVTQFISQHGVLRAEVVGGLVALPAAIDSQLRATGVEVVRFAGSNRYETNVLLAAEKFPSPSAAVVVRGDAQNLSGGVNTMITAMLANALGGQLAAPVLLVQGDEVPQVTAQYISDKTAAITLMYVVGDFRSIAQAVVNHLGSLQ